MLRSPLITVVALVLADAPAFAAVRQAPFHHADMTS